MSVSYVLRLLKRQPSIKQYEKVRVDIESNCFYIDGAYTLFGNVGRYIINKTYRKKEANRESLLDFTKYLLLQIQSIIHAQKRKTAPLVLSSRQNEHFQTQQKRLQNSLYNLSITYRTDRHTVDMLFLFIEQLQHNTRYKTR
jgi:hypothetical protein